MEPNTHTHYFRYHIDSVYNTHHTWKFIENLKESIQHFIQTKCAKGMSESTSVLFVQLLPVLTAIYTMYVVRILFFIFLISCFPHECCWPTCLCAPDTTLCVPFLFFFFLICSSRNEFPENICFVRSLIRLNWTHRERSRSSKHVRGEKNPLG